VKKPKLGNGLKHFSQLEALQAIIRTSVYILYHPKNPQKHLQIGFFTASTERVGHPEKLSQSLGVDVLGWYHPIVRVRQQKKHEMVGHPPRLFALFRIGQIAVRSRRLHFTNLCYVPSGCKPMGEYIPAVWTKPKFGWITHCRQGDEVW
jgi:hypothetical protein